MTYTKLGLRATLNALRHRRRALERTGPADPDRIVEPFPRIGNLVLIKGGGGLQVTRDPEGRLVALRPTPDGGVRRYPL